MLDLAEIFPVNKFCVSIPQKRAPIYKWKVDGQHKQVGINNHKMNGENQYLPASVELFMLLLKILL